MAEQFLTLMAELDDVSQMRISEWYGALQKAGFTGTQTPGLPDHISLAAFPFQKEREAAVRLRLCAFWPTREIASCPLSGEPKSAGTGRFSHRV